MITQESKSIWRQGCLTSLHRSSIETAESIQWQFQRLSKTINTHNAVGVVGQSFNQLMVETAYSANLALGDEMNVVQIQGGRGVGFSVDSTTFLPFFYNLQQKFEENLHQQINPKIYNLQFRQNALKYLKKQRYTFK